MLNLQLLGLLLESMLFVVSKDEEAVIFPQTTAIGALPYYITHTKSKHFQPMNINFGYHQRFGWTTYS